MRSVNVVLSKPAVKRLRPSPSANRSCDSSAAIARCVGPFQIARDGTNTTVAIRLRFSASPCTTTTGRRNPGSERSAGRSAHQTSPSAITTQSAPTLDGSPPRQKDRSAHHVGTDTIDGFRHFVRGMTRHVFGKRRAEQPLRDRFDRRASRSAFANTSSGIDTAVFILKV